MNKEIKEKIINFYKNKNINIFNITKRQITPNLHLLFEYDKAIKIELLNILNKTPEYENISNIILSELTNTPLTYCLTCNKLLPYSKRLNTTCSRKCINQVELVKKRKETMKKRYGVEITSQSSDLIKKIEETNLKKYGVKHVLQNKEIKAKQEQTCLKLYNQLNFPQKIKKTLLNKYGEKLPEYFKKQAEIRKNTWIKKYRS